MGVVRAVQANYYRVQLPHPQDPSRVIELLCTRRARLKKLGQQVVVGDRVGLKPDTPITDTAIPERGVIETVQERHKFLPRPPIANIDQALVVFALAEPPLDPWQLSRFLVQAEASQLTVRICLNKCDLVSQAEQDHIQAQLRLWGYEPLIISVKERIRLDSIKEICRHKLSVVTGLSGVGKSSLLNWLIPELHLSTQAVSGRLRHGQHTTRHVELFPLDDGDQGLHSTGWIADSPGFNQADLSNCASDTLIQCFPEVKRWVGSCQFRDCLHQQEPGCQIRECDWERHEHYLKFLEEVLHREAGDRASSQPDDTLKYQSTAKQQAQPTTAVPRLDSRFRQTSRRQRRQRSHQLTGEASTIVQSEDMDPES